MPKENKKFVCKICEKIVEYKGNYGFLIHHVQKFHNMNPQQYYDLYNRSKNEGICKRDGCDIQTKFISYSKGYRDYCGQSCANLDPKTQNKKEITCKEKYGVRFSCNDPKVREKKERTCKDKYGNKHFFGSEKGINIVTNIMRTKTRDEWDEITEKRKGTCEEKYGVDNPFKSEEIKERIKETILKKYGKNPVYDRKPLTKEKRDKISKILIDTNIDIAKQAYIDRLPQGYELLEYDGYCDRVKVKCENGHLFDIQKQLIRVRKNRKVPICTICNPISNLSQTQTILTDFIRDMYSGKILENHRKTIWPYELDIYLPDIKMAIEFNGLYFHDERTKSKDYHLKKTELAEKKGVHLIHIYEDDWAFKDEIVKSRLKNILGVIENRIPARKCLVKEIDSSTSNEFLDDNHLFGSCIDKIRLGLFYGDRLVSVMTFGPLRKNLIQVSIPGNYELLRFCNLNDHVVIGGISKLFKYFVNKYNPIFVVSYADRSWTSRLNHNVYQTIRFKFDKVTEPSYSYIVKNKRENRFKYNKHKLVKEGFDSLNIERKLFRIYNSGSLKYIWER